MRRLLQHLDKNILKWGVIFTSLFVVLYPKLPSVHINNTWVYIRLEDFVITALALIWLIQVMRRKAKLALPLGIPIILYWVVGLISLIFSILFIGPHLANFFPKIAALEYLRRIEYMILFFIGFSSMQSYEDLRDYLYCLFFAVLAVVLYGLGQHFYLYIWNINPKFFEHSFAFCFPSFQTGNEEFAKGIPLCLSAGSRIASTFAGDYDLAGYLVVILPITFAVSIFTKQKIKKVLLTVLFLLGLATLIFTSSRIAIPAYMLGIGATLWFLQKKKYIIPVFIVSILFLFLFSQSTVNRFLQTFRITSVVLNTQGQVVGVTQNSLPPVIQKQIAKGTPAIQPNVPSQALPAGTTFITIPQQTIVATSEAVVKKTLSQKQLAELKLANGGLELSTVSGRFTIQKALVYDISLTTRLQAEWPNATMAFLRNIYLGSGYSSITLASDSDYFRLLGETGLLGFFSFFFIFIVLGIYLKEYIKNVTDKRSSAYIYGVAGGVVGLFIYALLFDIFEASKVAEPLWILIGIACGILSIGSPKHVSFGRDIWKAFSSHALTVVYLLLLPVGVFANYVSTFFVGDDFIWLKWAAISTTGDIKNYFLSANGFFYRPLDKTVMLLLYSFFAFNPGGYHVVILLLHGVMGIAVYTLLNQLFKKKFLAFLGAVLFMFLPIHAENILWLSSLSIDLGSIFILFGVSMYIKSTKKHFAMWYGMTMLFAIFALLSYELAIVFPLFLMLVDYFLTGKKKLIQYLLLYTPFVLLDILYLALRAKVHALIQNGDYSYSLPHLLPNVFGNLFGYAGLFIFGEKFLPIYAMCRNIMKTHALPVGVLLLLIVIGGIVFVLKQKPWKKITLKNNNLLFGIKFMVISLLPYLALGNIAERYGYLASVGFVISILTLGDWVFKKIFKKGKAGYVILGIVLLILAVLFTLENTVSVKEWRNAGKITYSALGYFKIEESNATASNTFVIVNLPTRLGNAWIFPTGFSEGLWFIYRDSEPTIMLSGSLQQAKSLQIKNPGNSIFMFDNNYNVTTVN